MNFFLILLLLNSPIYTASKPQFYNGIVAVVGKKIILASDLKLKLTPHLARACQMEDPSRRKEALEALWKGALEDEIGNVLLEVEGQKHNIYIGSTEINSTIRVIIKQNRFKTLAQLKARLAKQNYPYLLLRKDLKRHLLKKQLLANLVSSKINIEEEAIKAYYLQKLREVNAEAKVTLLQLFIPKKKATSKLLKSIYKDIHSKLAFKDVVKKYKKGFGCKGTYRVEITPGTYSPQIDRVLFPKVKPKIFNNKLVYGPFTSDEGYYFIQIIQRIESGYLSYKEVKQKLKSELMRKKAAKRTKEWIKNLRNKYLVDIHLTSPPVTYLCHK